MKMRAIGNALVWVGLTIALPGVIYAMTVDQNQVEPASPKHDAAKCAVCRHYRGMKDAPSPIEDENMILVSPGHPHFTIDSSTDE
jgi:hypothetical protein